MFKKVKSTPHNNDIHAIENSETIIGHSVKVDGQFKSEGNIIIEGQVKGSIKSKHHLLIKEDAKVKANIEVGSAEISGEVIGNLKVSKEIKINSTAKIFGNIEADLIEISIGAQILGNLKMVLDNLPQDDKPETMSLKINKQRLKK